MAANHGTAKESYKMWFTGHLRCAGDGGEVERDEGGRGRPNNATHSPKRRACARVDTRERVRVHFSNIGRYERGEVKPSIEVAARLAQALGVSLDYLTGISDLQLDQELIAHISTQGFDPQFGARPIKRMIQKELLNELSKQIIAGTLETGKPQVIDVFDGKIVLRKPIDEKENGKSSGKKAKASA